MNPKAAKYFVALGILMLSLAMATRMSAQAAGVALSGTVTDPSGATVSNAKVSVKNLATGQTTETQTDSIGRYRFPNLAPGDYELAVSAEGFSTNTTQVTLPADAEKTADIKLAGVLSLGDLGFSSSETQANPAEQARLNKRSHMLKIHQRLGLITLVPLVATVATSFGAGGRSTSTTDRWVHLGLGAATGDLYFTTAYFAIFAPKIPGTHAHGPIRVHKTLAWIHGPGMILTPILGALAFEQKSKGERVHGLASAHGPVAIVTVGAYVAALVSVSFKF